MDASWPAPTSSFSCKAPAAVEATSAPNAKHPPRCYSGVLLARTIHQSRQQGALMPATTARISGAVKRMLDSGQVSRVDEASGVLQTLHANCPDDGQRASVRRMSREIGGPIMDVTMRCPACFR